MHLKGIRLEQGTSSPSGANPVPTSTTRTPCQEPLRLDELRAAGWAQRWAEAPIGNAPTQTSSSEVHKNLSAVSEVSLRGARRYLQCSGSLANTSSDPGSGLAGGGICTL